MPSRPGPQTFGAGPCSATLLSQQPSPRSPRSRLPAVRTGVVQRPKDKILSMDPKEITYEMVQKKLGEIAMARGKTTRIDRQEWGHGQEACQLCVGGGGRGAKALLPALSLAGARGRHGLGSTAHLTSLPLTPRSTAPASPRHRRLRC